MEKNKLPICVDLDGSLCFSDLLIEHTVLVLKQKPWLIFSLLFSILKGPLHFKEKILRLSPNNPELPFRTDLIKYLEEQKSHGRSIVLATASRIEWAQQVSESLPGLFDKVFASTKDINLKSQTKAAALEKEFGRSQYVYVGDCKADWPVFESAFQCIPVGNSSHIESVKKSFSVETSFVSPFSTIKSWIKATRVHQWAKNALLFLPILLAHKFEESVFIQAAFAFFSFSLLASSIYIVNDILDLSADRLHPKKKHRPFASGALSPFAGLFVSALLIVSAFAIGQILPSEFQWVLFAYFITTSLYSFYLKSQLLFDVVTLAGLFTLRIFAGSAATGIVISEWLLIFSIFFFFSLALMKRYIEILRIKELGKEDVAGRAYQINDQFMVGAIGVSSGLMAVLVSGIYLSQSVASKLYSHPQWLIGVSILIMYWISRVWILAERGQVNDDPIVFALKDKQSLVVGALAGFILWMAV